MAFGESYISTVRKNLAAFHKNLSKGDIAANGPLNAPDCHWNYDGNLIISREDAVATLKFVVEGSFRGLKAVDIYQIVDGNIGAVLYRVHANQTGEFAGIPPQDGARMTFRGGELFVFNEDALLRNLITIEPIGQVINQLSGKTEVPAVRDQSLAANPQTSPEYRKLLRRNMTQLHKNIIQGSPEANVAYAAENVKVDDNGSMRSGRGAFVELLSARTLGEGAFPEKKFHVDHIVADGKLGVIEYVLEAIQQQEYAGLPPGGKARMRGMFFFEFDGAGTITCVTAVHDEAVLRRQVSEPGSYLYP